MSLRGRGVRRASRGSRTSPCSGAAAEAKGALLGTRRQGRAGGTRRGCVTCRPSPSPCTQGCWAWPCCHKVQSDSWGIQTTHQIRAPGDGTGACGPDAWGQEPALQGPALSRGLPPLHSSTQHVLSPGHPKTDQDGTQGALETTLPLAECWPHHGAHGHSRGCPLEVSGGWVSAGAGGALKQEDSPNRLQPRPEPRLGCAGFLLPRAPSSVPRAAQSASVPPGLPSSRASLVPEHHPSLLQLREASAGKP